MSPIRVVLADALPVCLLGLRNALSNQPDIEVVAAVSSGEALVSQVLALRPDVIVLEVSLDGMSGIAALERIRSDLPSVRAVFISTASGHWIDLAYSAGASAALDKRDSLDQLPAVVRRVAAGQVLPPPARPPRGANVPLTAREIEVLRHIVAGMSSKEIATTLGTKPSTIEKHRESIRKKADLHNTVAIVKFGLAFFADTQASDRPCDTRDDPPQTTPAS